MKIVNVLIEYTNITLNRPFIYIYNGTKPINRGYRVILNFNNKEIIGYVSSLQEANKSKDELEKELGFVINEIIDVIDDVPLLNEPLLQLANRIADYYLSSKIGVLQCMLPPSLKPTSSSLKAPKIAYDEYVSCIDDSEEGLTIKQIELLRFIKKEKEVLKKELKSKSIVNKLLNLEKIAIIKKEKTRLKLDYQINGDEKKLTLDQLKIVNEFFNSTDSVYLLQGVTGSGKTEVYLHIAKEVLKQNKTVLILVPEISLTPMMTQYFYNRFSNDIAILHSELTNAQKYDEYRKIASNKAKIVIGARSAIFAPLSNLGLIIIDEEHSDSYKQDRSPFYHAREVAIFRSEIEKCKVLLASATPSLDSRARAQKGVYHLLRLNKRINNANLPSTMIINMLDYNNIDHESYIFSKTLRSEINKRLNLGEQIILLINRRGFSTSYVCRNCGHVFKCPNCNVPLTYHYDDKLLKCHHCEYMEKEATICPKCGGDHFIKIGFGSEKVELECKRLFKNARILRLDSDNAKIKSKIKTTLESFKNHEADILIGTQMIAKGHDFDNVTLVGVVLADIGLNMPSFKSSEKTFQILTQAIGRSGRGKKSGIAIIQTYNPSHYAITYAARQNFDLFYQKEMMFRKQLYYPPYCYLANLTISGKNETSVVENAYLLSQILKKEFDINGEIVGPSSPYISRILDNHIRVITIKFKDKNLGHEILKNTINSIKSSSALKITINIDPNE